MGTHFFNPVSAMRLLELVRALTTADDTLATVQAFGKAIGKRPIVSQDRAGFIVNYLLTGYLLDAIRMVEQGFTSREDIDLGMMLGTSYPMGPLSLIDFIGLDTLLSATEVFFDAFKEPRFAAPALVRQMVASGRLGRKTGRGFYTYQAGEQPPSAR
jgi:3-hydroxybutyryl-CoA dehydrogenase